jgi:PAS domain S-box-containing protein
MESPLPTGAEEAHPPFLSGGGEMGRRIREYDWSTTPLGPPRHWPQSLKTCVRIMLTSPQPMFVWWGREALVNIYNDAYRFVLGGKHPETLGRSGREAWAEIWDELWERAENVFTRNEGTFDEALLLVMNRYGYEEETYFKFSYNPIPGDAGGTEGLFCACTEETERIINERSLQTLRQLGAVTQTKTLDELFVSSAKTIAANDRDFPCAVIYSVDEASETARAAAIAGIDASHPQLPLLVDLANPDTIGRNLAACVAGNEIIHSPNNGRWRAMPTGAWDVPSDSFVHVPIRAGTKKHPLAVLSVALSPYRKYDARYQDFIQLVADQISLEAAGVLAYEEERKRSEALAEIDRAKTAFFTNISHEFRTPLTLMLGSLEKLLHKKNGSVSEDSPALESAYRNSLRLLRLVNNLLDFNRIEAGKVNARFVLLDVAEYTTGLASGFRSAIESAGLQFHVLCDTGVQPVYVDKGMWEKIVLNLLGNALKYTPRGSVSLSLSDRDDAVVLRVADTGVGIPESEQPKIFERFHRVENSRGRSFEGTGIGLSLVRELAQLHGGEISVSSTEGVGSEFSVSIPTGKAHLPEELIVQQEEEDPMALSTTLLQELGSLTGHSLPEYGSELKKDSPCVLVVDDNADMRAYVKSLLMNDFNVLTAGNGVEALRTIAEQKPDLVVSDSMMPVMDGIQLLKEIKGSPQTSLLPVILVSARAGEEARVEGIDTGADDYLTKPFSAGELLAKVRSNLTIAASRRKAEKFLYDLLMQSPVAIAIYKGPDFIVELANERMLELYGKSREEILHKPIFEVIPEVAVDGVVALHQSVYETGERVTVNELPLRYHRGGTLYEGYFNSVFEPFRDPSNNITGVIASAQDVTEQVLARKRVEESEERYATVINASDLGIWDFDVPSQRIVAAGRMDEIYGLGSNEEYTLEQVFQSIHPDDREAQNALFDSLRNGAIAPSFETEYRIIQKATGTVKWIRAIGKAFLDAEGTLYRTVGTVADVTRQKVAEERLWQSEQQLRLVTDAIPALISYVDKSERYQFNNRGYEDWFGHPAAGLKGKTIVEVLGEKAYAGLERYVRQALSGQPVEFESAVPYIDGGERHVLATYTPHFLDNGEVAGYYALVNDITERKKAEREFVFRKALLEAQNEAIPDALLIVDKRGGILSYNRHFAEIWRIPREVIEARDDAAALEYAMTLVVDPQGFIDRVNYCYAHPDEESYEQVLFKDGRTIERYGNPVRGDDGTDYGWIWYFRDITERIRAEKALRESETRFQNLVREASVGIVLLTGPEMKVDIVNKAYGQLIDRSPEELLGRELFSVIPQAEEKFLPMLEGVLRSGEPLYLYDTAYSVKKDDRTIEGFLNVVYQPYHGADGSVAGVLALCQDVTEAVKSKKALEESEVRFRTLAETLPQMIWIRNMDGNIEYASKNWEDYTGIKDMREAWVTMTHPDDWESVMSVWQKAMEAGLPFNHEVRMKNKEGEYRWQYAVGEPVKDEAGKVLKYIGALTDIHVQKNFSERLEQQVALRTSELQNTQSFLQQLIDSSVEYICVVDKGLNFITANKRVEESMRIDREQLKGKTLFDINPNVKGTQLHQSILKALSGEMVHLEKLPTTFHPDIVVDTYFVPLLILGKVEGVIIMARDVTAIVQSEKMLEKANRELQRSNEDLQQFAHVASHDLKEPVRKIMVFSNRLRSELGDELPENGRLYLSKVESSALRMYAMIDGVLLYSSLDALEQTKEGIELNEIVQNIESDLEVLIAQKEAKIMYSELPWVEGSHVLLYQLFYNLINNSLKFSSTLRKPVIQLSSAAATSEEISGSGLNPQKEYVRITLRDNGIGFARGEEERIFGTFTRLHSKDRYEGTGLGLSLCRKIAERHGGAIYARGEEGEGAVFSVLLPR